MASKTTGSGGTGNITKPAKADEAALASTVPAPVASDAMALPVATVPAPVAPEAMVPPVATEPLVPVASTAAAPAVSVPAADVAASTPTTAVADLPPAPATGFPAQDDAVLNGGAFSGDTKEPASVDDEPIVTDGPAPTETPADVPSQAEIDAHLRVERRKQEDEFLEELAYFARKGRKVGIRLKVGSGPRLIAGEVLTDIERIFPLSNIVARGESYLRQLITDESIDVRFVD